MTSMSVSQQLTLAIVLILNAFHITTGSELHALCEPTSKEARDSLVYKVLNETKKGLKESEPFSLPPEKGVMRLRDGFLFGVNQFHLRNDPTISCTDKEAIMGLLMGFNETMVRYVWDLAGIPGLSSGFRVFADRVTADILLKAPLNRDKPVSFKVQSVRVTELSGVWVKVDGLGVLAWIASQIGNLGVMITRTNLKAFLTQHLATSLQKVFDKYPV